jgi:hypothetical protein
MLLLLFAVPAALPGWRLLDEIRPLTLEYDYIRSMAPRLPRKLQLLKYDAGTPEVPGYGFPRHLLEEAGIEVRLIDLDRDRGAIDPAVPLLFFQGVFCHAYTVFDATGMTQKRMMFSPLPRSLRRKVFDSFSDYRQDVFEVPTALRPECVPFVRIGTPLGEARSVGTRTQDPPFAMYGGESIELRFYRLPPDGLP